jgi:hypothetical protein
MTYLKLSGIEALEPRAADLGLRLHEEAHRRPARARQFHTGRDRSTTERKKVLDYLMADKGWPLAVPVQAAGTRGEAGAGLLFKIRPAGTALNRQFVHLG